MEKIEFEFMPLLEVFGVQGLTLKQMDLSFNRRLLKFVGTDGVAVDLAAEGGI